MFIAIMVILGVIGLIVTAVFYMTPEDDGPRVKGKSSTSVFGCMKQMRRLRRDVVSLGLGSRFSLDDVLSNKFRARLFNGSWLQDNQLLTTDANNNFQLVDPETGALPQKNNHLIDSRLLTECTSRRQIFHVFR